MSEVDLSVIIVSWNVERLVVACLESIARAAKQFTVEVIVVDNNSADDTVTQVRSKFPQVKLIANDHNAGFAAATNQALTLCQGQYILLLNPDTELTEDSLTQMVSALEANHDIGLLGPMLQTPEGEIQEYCARSFPTPLNLFWYYSFIGQIFRSKTFSSLYMSYWDHKSSRQVDALAGAAMLMPRRTLDEVGFLDESHPMYFEDLDYCFRVWRAGRLVYYFAEAVVIHHGGESSRQVPRETKILILEACNLFFKRYGRRADPWLFRLALVAVFLVRLPVLGAVKLYSSLQRLPNSRMARINLSSEMIMFLWALGLVRQPEIETISV
jgi:GT2 family glycosyltransferase